MVNSLLLNYQAAGQFNTVYEWYYNGFQVLYKMWYIMWSCVDSVKHE